MLWTLPSSGVCKIFNSEKWRNIFLKFFSHFLLLKNIRNIFNHFSLLKKFRNIFSHFLLLKNIRNIFSHFLLLKNIRNIFNHFLVLKKSGNIFSHFSLLKIVENFSVTFYCWKILYSRINFFFFVVKNEKSSHVIMIFGKSNLIYKLIFKHTYLFFFWAYFDVHGFKNILLGQENSFCDTVAPTNVSEISKSDQTIVKKLKISPNTCFRLTANVLS